MTQTSRQQVEQWPEALGAWWRNYSSAIKQACQERCSARRVQGTRAAGPAAAGSAELDAAMREKGQETKKMAARGCIDWPQSLAPSASLLSLPESQPFFISPLKIPEGCGSGVAVAATGVPRLECQKSPNRAIVMLDRLCCVFLRREAAAPEVGRIIFVCRWPVAASTPL